MSFIKWCEWIGIICMGFVFLCFILFALFCENSYYFVCLYLLIYYL